MPSTAGINGNGKGDAGVTCAEPGLQRRVCRHCSQPQWRGQGPCVDDTQDQAGYKPDAVSLRGELWCGELWCGEL
ncbi:hypothetical protein HaLaN_00331 [Haematococcus lacustris]|uniref:Uncharacterized protein n=1 Tax=Haematococcus lacustris TaxID=44745 RepID=A0A699Y6M8_HAELA|nr:hypothetical protein HaLaN_00331 [Haematococcus lacustris]